MTSHAGFDISEFPGLATMAALKASTNLEWVVQYLVSPSHHAADWTGQRKALAAQGWGLAPVFVGQQVSGPGAHDVTMLAGTADGLAACARMIAEGYPAGSCVFLDLENGPPFAAPQTEYVRAWVASVRAGGWTPGVYCSHLIAAAVAAANPGARIFAFRVPTVERTGPEHAPFPTPNVALCGLAGAAAWQYRQNVEISGGGPGDLRLIVDLDVAATPDPSAP